MPRQWEPILEDFSRIQKLVHLSLRMDPVDIAAIAAEGFREKRRAYEDGLTIQAANAGCPGKRGMAGHDVLSEMKEEADKEAAGIVNTYNYDLAHAIRHIREMTPTSNRYVYAKRLREWEEARAEWKSKQISLSNAVGWQDRATKDFMIYNPQVSEGYAILIPQNIAVCDVCRYWVGRGRVPIDEARKVSWPAHINCPHRWETHYRRKRVDCAELWVGVPLSDVYTKENKAEEGGDI